MKKTTKKEMFTKLLDYVKDDVALTEFINHEIALVEKKNSAPKKPTARQNENETLKDDILAYMVADTEYTISDLQENIPSLKELSNQRISAIVSQLVDDNSLTRVIKKRKSYFSLA